MDERRGPEAGTIVIGLVIIGIGAWFLLRDTLHVALPVIDWNLIWPLLIIAVGLGVLWRAWDRDRRRG
jgi:hypothetical protein